MNPIEQLARKAAELNVAATPGDDDFTRRVLADIRAGDRRDDESAWGIGASVAVAAAVVALVLSFSSWSSLNNPLSPMTDASSFTWGVQ